LRRAVPGGAGRGLAVVTCIDSCIDSRIDPLAVLGLGLGDAKVCRSSVHTRGPGAVAGVGLGWRVR